jgi:hypothetical protein
MAESSQIAVVEMTRNSPTAVVWKLRNLWAVAARKERVFQLAVVERRDRL